MIFDSPKVSFGAMESCWGAKAGSVSDAANHLQSSWSKLWNEARWCFPSGICV